MNVRPADAGDDWTMPFPGRDNTVGKNVKTTADWYGEDYLRYLIETGQYDPAAKEGEQGYTSGLLTGKGSGTYQIPLNPDSKSMVSTTTFEGGQDLDPTTWNQTQKDAWLTANEGKTIEDAIAMYNPVEQQRHGGYPKYNNGGMLRSLMVGPAGKMSDSVLGKGTTNSMINKLVPGLGTAVGTVSKHGTYVKKYNDGGIVQYLQTERESNRNNNRILADQRISDFQRFMKNRK